MTVKLVGMAGLDKSFRNTIKAAEKRIMDVRKRVAEELHAELISKVPVWSGKTVRSVVISNSESGGNAREPHPQRGDTSISGPWKPDPRFGPTSTMAIGSEPMRSSSEAAAIAHSKGTDYSLDRKVFIVSNSYMWAEVNAVSDYRAPSRSRGTPVISAIATAKIREKFKGIVK